jgi:phosphotransferase system HPr (HPr) family protein
MAFIPSCVRPPECRIVLRADRPTIIISKSLLLLGVAIGAFMLLAKSAFQAAALNRMRKEVEIVNKLGLHARPAAQFVRCVIRFKSTITIWKGEENFSAASLLEVLSADLDCGDRVVLEAIGQEALNQLEALLLRFRDEGGGA